MSEGFGLTGGVQHVLDILLMGFFFSLMVVGDIRGISRVKLTLVARGLVYID